MSFKNYPHWEQPEHNTEWLGTWGVENVLDSVIILNNVEIPWHSGKTGFFSVKDYNECSVSELKSIALARRMAEKQLKKKAKLVYTLELWDAHFKNTTP
jgi:hypothetical protein